MRDFSNGGDMNVNGNLIINDNSNNSIGKPLINCTNEELLNERSFRKENLRLERNQKIKFALPLLTFKVIFVIAAAAWAQINGKSDLSSFALGIGSLVVGFATIKGVLELNAFEIEERNTIYEINMILKSRRVE